MTQQSNIATLLRDGLQSLCAIKSFGDYVRVTTHCMYPSNGLVNISVRAGHTTAVISDDGGAVSEAQSAGIRKIPADKYLVRLISEQGLKIENGIIYSPPVPFDAIPVATIIVANASKEIAEWLYRNAKMAIVRDFKIALEQLLQLNFDDRLRHKVEISGKRASHRFANVIALDDHRKLIVDPVIQEPSSISARALANLDVHQLGDSNIVQRIVYDDEEKWNPDNIALLGISEVPTIPFSRSPEFFRRMISHA